MKKIIVLVIFSALAISAFSQQSKLSATLTKQDYLKKRKTQTTIAWVLLGGGTIAWLAGVSKYMNQNDNKDGGGEAAMVIGGVAGLSSIPFFIMASKNKKRAASVSFKMEQSPYLKVTKTGYAYFPAVSYRLNLR